MPSLNRGWESAVPEHERIRREAIAWAMAAMGLTELRIPRNVANESLVGKRLEVVTERDALVVRIFDDVTIDGGPQPKLGEMRRIGGGSAA